MRIRNKQTGQIIEVMDGTLYPSFFEEVKDDEILVGEPKVEFEIENNVNEEPEKVDKKTEDVKKTVKRTKKTTKKGAKKNGNAKTKSN